MLICKTHHDLKEKRSHKLHKMFNSNKVPYLAIAWTCLNMSTFWIFFWSYCLLKKCKLKKIWDFLSQSRPLCSNYTIELWVCWFMFNWRSLYYMANKFYTRHKDLFLLLIQYLYPADSDQIWIMIYFKRKLGSHFFCKNWHGF